MSTVNAGENVASAIDEYIDDNPEVVLPILVGGGVSTAGVFCRKVFKFYLVKNPINCSSHTNTSTHENGQRPTHRHRSTKYTSAKCNWYY
jgi:hypothetical protein